MNPNPDERIFRVSLENSSIILFHVILLALLVLYCLHCDTSVICFIWRFRNFSFYPSIAPTGLVRAEDSLETETRFKEKRRK